MRLSVRSLVLFALATVVTAAGPFNGASDVDTDAEVFVRRRSRAAQAGESTAAAAARRAGAAGVRSRSAALVRSGDGGNVLTGGDAAHPVPVTISSDPASLTTLSISGVENVMVFNATRNGTCVDFTAHFLHDMNGNGTVNNATLTVLLGAKSAGVPTEGGEVVTLVARYESGDGRTPTSPVDPTGAAVGVPAGEALLAFVLDPISQGSADATIVVTMEQLECDSTNHATCAARDVEIRANPQPGQVTKLEVDLHKEKEWSALQYDSVFEDGCLDFVATVRGGAPAKALTVDVCTSAGCPDKACDADSTVRLNFGPGLPSSSHARTPSAVTYGPAYLGLSATGSQVRSPGGTEIDLAIEQIPCGSNGTVTCPAGFQYIEDASRDTPTVIALGGLEDAAWRLFSFAPLHGDTCLEYSVYVRPDAPLNQETTFEICTSNDCPTEGCTMYEGITLNAGAEGKSKTYETSTARAVHRTGKGIGYFAVRTVRAGDGPVGSDDTAFLFLSQVDCAAEPSPTASPSVAPSGSPTASPSVEPSPSPSPEPACPGATQRDIPMGSGFVKVLNATTGGKDPVAPVVIESRADAQATCVDLEVSLAAIGGPGAGLAEVTVHACWDDVCPGTHGGPRKTCTANAGNTLRISSASSGPQRLALEASPVNSGSVGYLTIIADSPEGTGSLQISARTFACAPACPGASRIAIPSDGERTVTLSAPVSSHVDWKPWSFRAELEDTCVMLVAELGATTSVASNEVEEAPKGTEVNAPGGNTKAPASPTVPRREVGLRCQSTDLLGGAYCDGLIPSRVCAESDVAEEIDSLSEEGHRAYAAAVRTRCGTAEYAYAMCPNDPSRAPACAEDAGSRRDYCASGFNPCRDDGTCQLRCYSSCYPCHARETCDALVGKVFAPSGVTDCVE